MKKHLQSSAKALSVLGLLCAPSLASAAGLGNLTYTDQELFKPVSNFGGTGAYKWKTGPTGANTALMLHQKLVIMASNDSGKAPGSFHVYDVSDPRKPVLQKTLDGTPETSKLRELHAMPVAMVDGRTLLVFPTVSGIQFFDFTDPLDPKPAGTFDIPDLVKGGDYDNTIWMLSWQWPYVFAGATGAGIFVIDATDPAHCSLTKRITTGVLGNFRIGPTYAAGNFLLGMNMDQAGIQVAVINTGDPKAPFLTGTGKTPANLYSSLVIGDRIYGAGTDGDYVILKWSGTSVSSVATGKSGKDRGGYCTYQSGFAVCGQSSEGFKKWDTRNDKLTYVGNGVDPNGAGGDFDFSTFIGNLVFLGNDHGSGSALIPHQKEPDSVAPTVVKVYPNEAKQPTTSRITLFFSEDLDLDTVTSANIVVRAVGGAVVPGVLGRSSFNAISFGPKAPLAANTTYEVSVTAGGVTDLVGNKLTETSSTRFSTGPTIDTSGSGGQGAGGTSSQGGAAGSVASGGSSTGAGSSAGGSSAGGATSAGASNAVAGSTALAGGGAASVSAGAPGGDPGSSGAADEGAGCAVHGGAAPQSKWALGVLAGLVWAGLRRRNRRDS